MKSDNGIQTSNTVNYTYWSAYCLFKSKPEGTMSILNVSSRRNFTWPTLVVRTKLKFAARTNRRETLQKVQIKVKQQLSNLAKTAWSGLLSSPVAKHPWAKRNLRDLHSIRILTALRCNTSSNFFISGSDSCHKFYRFFFLLCSPSPASIASVSGPIDRFSSQSQLDILQLSLFVSYQLCRNKLHFLKTRDIALSIIEFLHCLSSEISHLRPAGVSTIKLSTHVQTDKRVLW